MKDIGHEGLNNLLAAYEDKSAKAVCTFGFSQGPGHEPILFQGITDVSPFFILIDGTCEVVGLGSILTPHISLSSLCGLFKKKPLYQCYPHNLTSNPRCNRARSYHLADQQTLGGTLSSSTKARREYIDARAPPPNPPHKHQPVLITSLHTPMLPLQG